MNGKTKGSQYERDVCKKLSLWISCGKDSELFWRSAMSGGRATLATKKGKSISHQAGDISAVKEEGHVLTNKFAVECKNYADLGLPNFFMGNPSPLTGFWNEIVKVARQNKKLPMLIAKQNYYPEIILLPGRVEKYVFFKKAFPHTIIKNGVRGQELVVAFTEEFFEDCVYRVDEE